MRAGRHQGLRSALQAQHHHVNARRRCKICAPEMVNDLQPEPGFDQDSAHGFVRQPQKHVGGFFLHDQVGILRWIPGRYQAAHNRRANIEGNVGKHFVRGVR